MSIFTDLKPHASNVRNVFDLSRSKSYSSKCGLINVVHCLQTVPDSDYRIKLSSIVRTAPMQTANFEEIKTNFETFFVPYSQLWRGFNRMYYGRGEDTRNIANDYRVNHDASRVPRFDYKTVVQNLLEYGFYQMIYEFHFRPWIIQYQNLDTGNAIDNVFTSSQLLDFATFVKKFPDYFFGSDYESLPGSQLNFRSVHGDVCALECLRTFDMLGYGNWLPVLKSLYSSYASYYSIENDFSVTNIDDLSEPLNTAFEIIVYNTGNTAAVLSGMASYLHEVFQTLYNEMLVDQIVKSYQPSALALMAFMKIRADYYRSTQYDNTDYAFFYNADYIQRNSQDSLLTPQKVIFMLKPFYHLYKRDIFTGSYSDTQFGDVALAGLPSSDTDSFLKFQGSDTDVYLLGNGTQVHTSSSSPSEYTPLQLKSQSLGLSVLAMRQAIALQHWKESILRAGSREQDLQNAIFGVSSKYIQDEYVDFLDGVAGTINVNPIAATAATDSADIGELGAYSVGTVQGDEIRYHAKDFGLIITVEYIMPEVKYNAYGLDSMHTKVSQFDFYNPKLQNLGLAPVYSNQLNVFSDNMVLGYLSRYHEYKTAVSEVHGEFYNSSPLELNLVKDGFSLPFTQLSDLAKAVFTGATANMSGSKSFWVAPRTIDNVVSMSLQSLYVNPHDLDNLFYSAGDGSQTSDQFDFETYFEVKAIQPMTVTGLPTTL